MKNDNLKFLLVEPISKTPYPPLGLMKISTMLKDKYQGCKVIPQIGKGIPGRDTNYTTIFITSLFTWDWRHLVDNIQYYQKTCPNSEIQVGGISASLLGEEIEVATSIRPHQGLYKEAEFCSPDYSIDFKRRIKASITFTSRGCTNDCNFCSVRTIEPDFFTKDDWENDICEDFSQIIFWDNNFLASPNFEQDCEKLIIINKRVDFNQGLDVRLLDENRASKLFKINIDPVRIAFDDVHYEKAILKGIRIIKRHVNTDIIAYVLYNYEDSPEDLYYRINLLNKEGILSFPMEYRAPSKKTHKMASPNWNMFLLRAFKLSLLFYYRKGMITKSRSSFVSIYGKTEKEFVNRLYEIYEYDRTLGKTPKN